MIQKPKWSEIDQPFIKELKPKDKDIAKNHEKAATLTLKLSADSGYQSDESIRVSPEQWGRIQNIINEEDV